MFEKRISIFVGHFGSGKTEVAVNYALKLSKTGQKTAIVDFDIVNPYFRTTDAKSQLEANGIWAVVPMYANTNVDVPALPPEINTLFEKKDYRIVFDVGGDDLGARVLSRYRDEILADEYELFFVINTRRPMTDTRERIEDMIREIEASSRLKVTRLVNNTNLLGNTSEGDILAGHELVTEVSKSLGIPVGFASMIGESSEDLKNSLDCEIFSMDKNIRLPWE